jgi:hypothetical protein
MANSNGNVDGVPDFLNAFHGNEAYADEAWSPYNPTVPWSYYPDNESMAIGSDTISDQGSNYTYKTKSSRARTARSESVFSQPRNIAASSVGQSTAPPHRRTTFAGADEVVSNNDFVLWCEFRELKGCNVTFRGDDEATWIQHHARHLGDQFPSELVCWFCDDHPHFKAKRTAERRANFEDRMGHIRGHIFSDWEDKSKVRPDFFLLSHMYKHGRLDEETYQYVMKYSEVPRPYQWPGGDEPRSSRSDAVQIDIEKEERHRRRANKKKSGWH